MRKLLLLFAVFLQVPLVAQTATEYQIFPSELGSPSSSIIALPPNYETSGLHYPVIYMLPGNGNPPGADVLNRVVLDKLMNQGDMLPVIFVAPNRNVVPSNGVIYDTIYAEHLAREVVPYIDDHYRTIPRREARAIAGFSRGGREAWTAALRYPETFRFAGSYAFGSRHREAIPGLLNSHKQHRFPLEFWNYYGRRDTSPIGFLVEQLNELGLPNYYFEDGGGHAPNTVIENQIYFSYRLWEEANATDPYPIIRFTRQLYTRASEETTLDIEAVLQPQDEMPGLVLDGSALGLDPAVPLVYKGEGRYALQLELSAPRANGLYNLPVRFKDGARVSEAAFIVRLNVYPSAEQALYAEALSSGWENVRRLTLDPQAASEVFEGTKSLGLEVSSGFGLNWTPVAEQSPLGYVLRFAFHPGTATGGVFFLTYKGPRFSSGFNEVQLLDSDTPEGQRLDLDLPAWQTVEIPFDGLDNTLPLEGLSFGGDLNGTFYLDDIRLVPQSLLPEPTTQTFPPALHFDGGTEDVPVVAGRVPSTIDIEIVAQVRAGNGLPPLRLDASAVGASPALDLNLHADGRYTAQVPLDPDLPNGIYRLPIRMDAYPRRQPSLTDDQDHDTEVFATPRLLVYPDKEKMLYADTELIPEIEPGRSFIVALDPQATQQIFAGSTSLAVQPKLSSTSPYLTWTAATPAFGYSTLHFALHPGDLSQASDSPGLTLIVENTSGGSTRIELLDADMPLVDIQTDTWQTVEIPLGDQPIQSISLEGSLKGTFFLDDVRLVPHTPPAPPTAVLEERQNSTPQSFGLEQNYPNPFNSGTVIRFGLPDTEAVQLHVFNLAGQQVATLLDGSRNAGSYKVHWDGRDDQGRSLASGLYLYRLQAGERIESRKLTLLR